MLNDNGVVNITMRATPAGMFTVLGSPEPTLCASGTYRRETGGKSQSECTICPEGFYCNAGCIEPVVCESSVYCPKSSGNYTMCPSGSYCPFQSSGIFNIS